jgi:uncharacterized Tic20 family protein
MSDTTPRPDETPGDPTAPPAESAWTPPPPPPAYEQPQAPYHEPQPSYQQQQLPPAHAGATPGTAVAGPNPMTPTQERTTGMAAHGVALGATVLSGGFLGFVAALVMYLVFRDRGPFVRHHSANALNVQIIAGLVMLISLPLMFVLIGFVTFAAAWVFAVVVHVIGMVKANNGEWYSPPVTPQFVK